MIKSHMHVCLNAKQENVFYLLNLVYTVRRKASMIGLAIKTEE